MNSIAIKVCHESSVRRFTFAGLTEANSFAKLLTIVRCIYPQVTHPVLSYVDEEGDKCTISTSIELAEAVAITLNQKKTNLRLSVSSIQVTHQSKPQVDETKSAHIQDYGAESVQSQARSESKEHGQPDVQQSHSSQARAADKQKSKQLFCEAGAALKESLRLFKQAMKKHWSSKRCGQGRCSSDNAGARRSCNWQKKGCCGLLIIPAVVLMLSIFGIKPLLGMGMIACFRKSLPCSAFTLLLFSLAINWCPFLCLFLAVPLLFVRCVFRKATKCKVSGICGGSRGRPSFANPHPSYTHVNQAHDAYHCMSQHPSNDFPHGVWW